MFLKYFISPNIFFYHNFVSLKTSSMSISCMSKIFGISKIYVYLLFVFKTFPMPKFFVSLDLFNIPNMFLSSKFFIFSKTFLLNF